MNNLIEIFHSEETCEYRGETYRVRDNGAIYRCKKTDSRKSPLDETWTFGKPDKEKGYLNFSSQTVHRIVATAFHGTQPSEKHIVDHIDTNKKNNRPENLRWITRLENILINPITLSRILFKYGSIDDFLADPGKPINGELEQNFEWMRTVSKEEAENTKQNLLKWAKDGKLTANQGLGDWVHTKLQRTEAQSKGYPSSTSLTQNAIQLNWSAKSEFPNCPKEIHNNPILEYAQKLKENVILFHNPYYMTVVLKSETYDNGESLLVLYEVIKNKESDQRWGIMEIFNVDEKFIHEIITNYNGTQQHYWLIDTENHFNAILNNTDWQPKYDSQGREYKDDYMPF